MFMWSASPLRLCSKQVTESGEQALPFWQNPDGQRHLTANHTGEDASPKGHRKAALVRVEVWL
jgi:hypothetical protein